MPIKLPRGPKGSAPAKAHTNAFASVREAHGFLEFSPHTYVTPFSHCWIGGHLDSVSLQTIAIQAYRAVNDYFLGKRGWLRFKGNN